MEPTKTQRCAICEKTGVALNPLIYWDKEADAFYFGVGISLDDLGHPHGVNGDQKCISCGSTGISEV